MKHFWGWALLEHPTPRIALFVGSSVRPSMTKFAALSCLAHIVLSDLAHSTNDEYQESAVLFEPLYTSMISMTSMTSMI